MMQLTLFPHSAQPAQQTAILPLTSDSRRLLNGHARGIYYDLDRAVDLGEPILIALANEGLLPNPAITEAHIRSWRTRQHVWIAEYLVEIGYIWGGEAGWQSPC
jgi:hypothetical protein